MHTWSGTIRVVLIGVVFLGVVFLACFASCLDRRQQNARPARSVGAAATPSMAALVQAINDRYFALVELSFNAHPDKAHFIAQQMAASRNYDLIAKIQFQSSWGIGNFYLWRSAAIAGQGNFTSVSQVTP